MPTLERPRLRPDLAAARDGDDPRFLVLWDQRGLSTTPARITPEELPWVQLFDGTATLPEIQHEAVRRADGTLVPLEQIADVVRRLDEAYLLASERFLDRFARAPEREPSCVPCYGAEPDEVRKQLRALFTGPGGPGLPSEGTPDGRLRAALIPHIDYGRGGATFAWGFKEVFEHTNARLFVVIGTSHYSRERFTLTRQNFRSPLGVAPTDAAFVDRLAELYGPGLFDDPFAHIYEHSIELEVVFLQYLYENRGPIRIVPLVVGSFHDCVASGTAPTEMDDIRRMAAALRQVEAEAGEPVCTIISGDLAHIGPKFGDPVRVHEKQLAHCRTQDAALLRHAAAVDAAGYFQVIQAENDDRRICGLPPTYVALEAVRPSAGKLLHYNQHVHPRGNECVSFASMAFYQ